MEREIYIYIYKEVLRPKRRLQKEKPQDLRKK